jgi:FlaA1/EpsC-like NDP-sugar epimerase
VFKRQIKDGGPITVTDKEIVRYFMTIPEAVELVIQSGAMGHGGDVFVLDMGEPVKIYDLAVKMIHLSGLQLMNSENPEGDIEIKFTGLRPGEKLFEELLIDKNVAKTKNNLIMRAKESEISWSELKPALLNLESACLDSNQKKIRQLLTEIVSDYSPKSPIVDLTYNSEF